MMGAMFRTVCLFWNFSTVMSGNEVTDKESPAVKTTWLSLFFPPSVTVDRRFGMLVSSSSLLDRSQAWVIICEEEMFGYDDFRR